MTPLRRLLTRRSGERIEKWFSRIATDLLGRYRLIAGDETFRILQIEFCLRSPSHPDPFVHGFPIQHQKGRWYFHRVGRGYRGGTYKGMDLTFGDVHSLGGILFRALENNDNMRIQGPSKLVDHLLKTMDVPGVPELDALIATRTAEDGTCPLFLQRQQRPEPLVMMRRKRVGLSMKRATPTSGHAEFLDRLYWFGRETNPGSISISN